MNSFYMYLFPIPDFAFPLLGLNGVFPLKYFEPVSFRVRTSNTLQKKGHNYHLTLNVERIFMETKISSSDTEFTIRHFNSERQNMTICCEVTITHTHTHTHTYTHTHTHTLLCINKCKYLL
jgi:hypothetical protein